MTLNLCAREGCGQPVKDNRRECCSVACSFAFHPRPGRPAPPCGTSSKYTNGGCRCEECRVAHRKYRQGRRGATRAKKQVAMAAAEAAREAAATRLRNEPARLALRESMRIDPDYYRGSRMINRSCLGGL